MLLPSRSGSDGQRDVLSKERESQPFRLARVREAGRRYLGASQRIDPRRLVAVSRVSANKRPVNLRPAAAPAGAASTAPSHHSTSAFGGPPAHHSSPSSIASRVSSADGRRSGHSLSPHGRSQYTAGRCAAGDSSESMAAAPANRH